MTWFHVGLRPARWYVVYDVSHPHDLTWARNPQQALRRLAQCKRGSQVDLRHRGRKPVVWRWK